MDKIPNKRRRLINTDIMEMITLVSKEGVEFQYPIIYTEIIWKGYHLSELLNMIVEDMDMDDPEPIPLLDCETGTLRVFIKFSELFHEHNLVEFEAPIISDNLTDMGIKQIYIDFLDDLLDEIGIKLLMRMCEEMSYMQCSSLKNLIGAFIASKIKTLDEDQIKIFLRIKTNVACAGAGC
jgi:hypothetical protein